VPDEVAVLVGDVFSTGYHAARQGGIDTGDTVAVFGCGPIGLAAAASAQLFGPRRVFAIDVFENRLALAEGYGAIPLNAKDDPINKILAATDMEGVDVAVEAVGSTATFGQALSAIRRGGMLSVVGLFNQSYSLPLQMFGLYGLRLHMGLGNLGHMKQLMTMVADGKIDLSPFCTHVFPLADAMEAYDLFENHKDECLKVMLKVAEA
jgi:alcohol dehydrogenase